MGNCVGKNAGGTAAARPGTMLHTLVHSEDPELRKKACNSLASISDPDGALFKAKYDMVKLLGAGAFARVFQIRNKSSGELFAAKFLNRSLLEDDSSEIAIMEVLQDQPAMIRILEAFNQNSSLVLVLEYLEGGMLFDHITRKGHYGEREAGEMMRALLNLLAFCHAHHIVHRDLKPENLLLADAKDEHSLRVIDWGTAALIPKGGKLANVIGTPYYVAPEVLAREYDEKADIWSAGVILFILLSGHPPFSGVNDDIILNKVKKGEFSFSHEEWREVTPEAKDMISQMLTKDPAKRPSAVQLLKHPWFKISKTRPPASLGSRMVHRLQQFVRLSKLRRLALVVLARNMSDADVVRLRSHLRAHTSHEGHVDLEGLQRALMGLGVHMPVSELQNLIDAIDEQHTGEVDLDEFVAAVLVSNRVISNWSSAKSRFMGGAASGGERTGGGAGGAGSADGGGGGGGAGVDGVNGGVGGEGMEGGVERLSVGARQEDLVRASFEMLDHDHDGFISPEDLMYVLPEGTPQEEARQMLLEVDQEGRVNYGEFKELMQPRSLMKLMSMQSMLTGVRQRRGASVMGDNRPPTLPSTSPRDSFTEGHQHDNNGNNAGVSAAGVLGANGDYSVRGGRSMKDGSVRGGGAAASLGLQLADGSVRGGTASVSATFPETGKATAAAATTAAAAAPTALLVPAPQQLVSDSISNGHVASSRAAAADDAPAAATAATTDATDANGAAPIMPAGPLTVDMRQDSPKPSLFNLIDAPKPPPVHSASAEAALTGCSLCMGNNHQQGNGSINGSINDVLTGGSSACKLNNGTVNAMVGEGSRREPLGRAALSSPCMHVDAPVVSVVSESGVQLQVPLKQQCGSSINGAEAGTCVSCSCEGACESKRQPVVSSTECNCGGRCYAGGGCKAQANGVHNNGSGAAAMDIRAALPEGASCKVEQAA